MATTADTVARLEKLRAFLPFPANLLDGVQHLTDIYSALVSDGVAAGREKVAGYRDWLMRWAISPELTGPVDGPLPQLNPKLGALPDAPPIQAWMDCVVKTLDELRDCLTPDVVDALAQGRREGNRLGILRARSYVQALHETLDSLAHDTNIVLCRVSAAPDEDPADEKLKLQTISLAELHLVMFPGGSRADGLARQVRELVDRWTDLKYDFQKGACRWNLVELVSATLIAVKATESGLNSAQQLLVDARARADEIVEAVSDWNRPIHDRDQVADPLEIIRSAQIESKLRDLEGIPCEEMGVDGRMVSGQFNRVEGYVRRLATEVRAFLGEISAAEEDPEMYADPGCWFTARDFQAIGLELDVAINEAVLSHWPVQSETVTEPADPPRRELVLPAIPIGSNLSSSELELRDRKGLQVHPKPQLAATLGVNSWNDLAVTFELSGLCFRANDMKKLVPWAALGLPDDDQPPTIRRKALLGSIAANDNCWRKAEGWGLSKESHIRRDKRDQRGLIDDLQGGVRIGTVGDEKGACIRRKDVHFLNKALKSLFDLDCNPIFNEDGYTKTRFGRFVLAKNIVSQVRD